jgi:hypothetical protein
MSSGQSSGVVAPARELRRGSSGAPSGAALNMAALDVAGSGGGGGSRRWLVVEVARRSRWRNSGEESRLGWELRREISQILVKEVEGLGLGELGQEG